jgi:hypothetical protein
MAIERLIKFMTLQTIDLKQGVNWLSAELERDIIALITASFNGVDGHAYYAKYFLCPDAFDRKLRLYFDQQKVVGYCLISFTGTEYHVLLNASAAFYPDYRKGGNTFAFSMQQAFLYWLKNPFKRIFYADTMLSPAMYRAIANKAAIVWPSVDNTAFLPQQLFEQFNQHGRKCDLLDARCLLDVGRRTNYTEQEVDTFRTSNKKEIAFFCQVNPDFDKGVALFVIMPITLKQLLFTAFKVFT